MLEFSSITKQTTIHGHTKILFSNFIIQEFLFGIVLITLDPQKCKFVFICILNLLETHETYLLNND